MVRVIWVAVAGVAVLILLAGRFAVRWGGWGWFLAGAAGWAVAQGAKYVALLPFLGRGGAPLAASGWFALGAALLAGVAEELGKYVPLRLMRARRREAALALGLGAGALEAATVLAALVASALTLLSPAPGLAASLLPVWERFWAVTTHAGLAAIDAVAVVRRQTRWLLLAMGLHALTDVGAGWYQHLAAIGAPPGRMRAAANGEEALVAVLAVGIWWLGLALWRRVPPEAAAPAAEARLSAGG